MIQRQLQETIQRAMATFPAVLVTGPRQSGKTTLLRSVWGRTHRYVSLENADTRQRAQADPIGFLRFYRPPCILDEFQYAPELLSYLKTAIDEDRKPGSYLLTGSQHFSLMQGVSQSLAGRVAVLTLLPLSWAEVTRRATPLATLDEILERDWSQIWKAGKRGPGLGDWLLRGAYPEIRANRKADRFLWCGSYVQTYLERDVRSLLQVGDLNTFQRFVALCALRTGQLLNYSDLARDTGISVPTAQKWLSVLVASHQVFLLPPYHRSRSKQLVKSPKLYFLDTGLASFLCGLHTPEVLVEGPQAGAFFETTMLVEWLKAFLNRGQPPGICFWRSHDGLEIDFVLERNGKLYPIEAKRGATIGPADAASIARWRRVTGADAPGVILSTISRPEPVAPGVTAVPWQAFFA